MFSILRLRWAWLTLLLVSSLVAACVSFMPRSNPDYQAAKPHHRPDGFVNRYAERSEKEGLWRWQWERLRDGLPKPPAEPIVGVEPDLGLINRADGRARVTWVGHATVLLQVDGVNILTDPHWGPRASPVSFAGPKRHQPPGVPFEQLPPSTWWSSHTTTLTTWTPKRCKPWWTVTRACGSWSRWGFSIGSRARFEVR